MSAKKTRLFGGSASLTTLLFLGAILAGSLAGSIVPGSREVLGGVVDPLILLLVGSLFFTVRLDGLPALRRAPRTVLLALSMNFLLIPVIAFTLTLLLPGEALRIGVLIYCLFPCTDWFLGFTRMAAGETSIGAALIPLQMTLQLALYPVWLAVFTGHQVSSTIGAVAPALLTWFAVPAGAAIVARVFLLGAPPRVSRHRILGTVDRAIPFVISAVILCLFAANVETILHNLAGFAWVLLVVFLFFVATYVLGQTVGRVFRLRYPEHVLLTMTTSARNAPLMLAVTTVALPNQPVVYAAIILRMLIEFPHLTVITHLLRRRAPALTTEGMVAVAS
ncbi:symporter [Glaciihabitans sp. INWT7]|nr:symporter [Glaciihabitans sp. INWT7]